MEDAPYSPAESSGSGSSSWTQASCSAAEASPRNVKSQSPSSSHPKLAGDQAERADISIRITASCGPLPGRAPSDQPAAAQQTSRLERWLRWFRWRRPPPLLPVVVPPQPAPTRKQLAVARWQQAGRAIIASRAMAAEADVMNDRLAPPADRLHALVQLAARATAVAPGRPRRRLGAALLARQASRLQTLWERLQEELYITGEAVVGFFTPAPHGQHWPFFTLLTLAALAAVFFAMAGEYPAYGLVAGSSGAQDCVEESAAQGRAPYGPRALARWVAPAKRGWCFGGKPWAFDGEFLIEWGARWAAAMRKEPQRWLTSVALHQTFMHLLSNGLLFLVLALQLEVKYGWWRTAAAFVAAGVGGNLFSAAWESPCIAVVGASGGIFGLAGVYLADMGLNWETLRRPALRSAGVVGFAAFVAVTVGTTPAGTSHLSHVGGFVVGLLAGLLLPNPHKPRRWEAWLPLVGVAGLAALFVALPCYFYLSVLPSSCCNCIT